MSGGHFGISYTTIHSLADDLDWEISEQNPEYVYKLETIVQMKKFVKHLHKVAQAVKAIDYLYSGDSGEEIVIESLIDVLNEKPISPTYQWDRTLHNL